VVREKVYLGLGANLGDPRMNCISAIRKLNDSEYCDVLNVSPFYRTEPVGMRNQPWFVNCAVLVTTSLSPVELYTRCSEIEASLNRSRTIRWGPRTIDIDLLLWPGRVCVSKKVYLPHPRMHLRKFVLLPLCDIGADTIHPISGCRVDSLLESLSDRSQVLLISDEDQESKL
jgi:2-amino-4-hydroxy-6-hydroxymethyldihydropteridine diphosphokinase